MLYGTQVLRLLRVLQTNKRLSKLFQTVTLSIPQAANLSLLLLLAFFIFGVRLGSTSTASESYVTCTMALQCRVIWYFLVYFDSLHDIVIFGS